jgi:ribosomal protein L37E
MKVRCKNCGETNYPTTKIIQPCWNCGYPVGIQKAEKAQKKLEKMLEKVSG